jgi:hypothetical protein
MTLSESQTLAIRWGDIYWIPDRDTGMPDERHPWVVVGASQRSTAAFVRIMMRTSTLNGNWKAGLFTPAGIVPDLDRPGIILPGTIRSLPAAGFAGYKCAGRLPDDWLKALREYTSLRYPEWSVEFGWRAS